MIEGLLHGTMTDPGAAVSPATDSGSGSVALVDGAEAEQVIPEPPLSLPITDDYDWEDDFDFGSCDELPEEMRWPELGSAAADDEPPGAPNDAWRDDPNAHHRDIVDYMKHVYAHSQSSDEFVAALTGLFPDLREKVDRGLALLAEYRDLDDDELPSPDDDIAAGRGVIYLSGAEMLAAELAEDLELESDRV